ncbi:restriction endonuclease subunit S, partial [Faecalibacillus intestinalis]|uniref:restriction endonuclease subunit S n=1 Tax=Faecalibacillus intestinalis TaxID=1982626 RepID=UPI0032BF96ED
MKYYFDNPIFQNKINKESSGTAQKGFYLKQLNHSLIAVPPLEEQKRIVKKIEELEPLIDEYKKAEEQ